MNIPDYPDAIREARETSRALDTIERERFGIDHQETGYAMAIKWRLPEEFANAIRYHHKEEASARHNNLRKMVRAADNFAMPSSRELGPEDYMVLSDQEAILGEVQKILDSLIGDHGTRETVNEQLRSNGPGGGFLYTGQSRESPKYSRREGQRHFLSHGSGQAAMRRTFPSPSSLETGPRMAVSSSPEKQSQYISTV